MVSAMLRLLSILVLTLTVAACTTTEPDGQAQQLTLKELTEAPGYAWFPAEMATYSPRDMYVQQVSSGFRTDSQKVCVFVKPSCSCTGTQKLFPQIMKTLIASGVDMDRVEIWSMRSESDGQPYSSIIQIQDLPEIWIVENGQPFSQVQEAGYNLANADSLIAEAFVP